MDHDTLARATSGLSSASVPQRHLIENRDSVICGMCRRNDGIKSKLTQETKDELNSRADKGVGGEVHAVQVTALRNTIRDGDLNWSEPEKELQRHKAALKFLKSDEYLNAVPPPDQSTTWARERHHIVCMELLRLHAGGCNTFVVKHLQATLGHFYGHLDDLEKIIYEVDMGIAKEDVAKNRSSSVRKTLRLQRSGSSFKGFPEKGKTPAIPTPSVGKNGPEEVPLVSVCVQGGAGTVRTVKDAVMNATPALLIKGSGQAACLMADAVVIKDYKNSRNQKTMLDEQQKKLLQFVDFIMFVFQIESDTKGSFSYTKLIECLRENSMQLEAAMKTYLATHNSSSNSKWAKFRKAFCFEFTLIPMSERFVGVETPLASAMRVEGEGSLFVSKTYEMDTSQFLVCEMLCNVFQAANTGKCQVFDLHNTEPDAKSFKESLLECLLNGICPSEEDTPYTFGRKVRYTVRWECNTTLLELLKQNKSVKAEEKEEVLKQSLIEAIARNNVSAVNALFEDTHVSVDQFDVGLRLNRKYDILKLTEEHNDQRLSPHKRLSPNDDALVIRYFQSAALWYELLSRIQESSAKESDHLSLLKNAAKSNTNRERLNRAKEQKENARTMLENSTPSDLIHGNSSSSVTLRNRSDNEFNFRLSKYEKRLLVLEQIYRDLLGKNFEYHIGSLGPNVDLFFINVLVRFFVPPPKTLTLAMPIYP